MRSPGSSLPLLAAIAILVAVALGQRDEIRGRAESGLDNGMPAREANLARGFVLGEDDEIDPATKEDFRRSGLSHLLAVSGENVTLLALLAAPLLGALGIPLRARLVWLLGLIAVYVPVAGAGPSIQRAGVMGAVGVLATLGGRRASRLYALALAALVTLAVDPGVAADVGWQLSFAAVLGILLLSAPLRRAIVARLGPGPWRAALAEGLAVTISATLATAPLIARVFGTVSTTSLVANVLAMPAVAPAMWLGMASAAAAQIPGVPLEPLNGLDALLLAYVAQIAAWCASPSWAEVRVQLGLLGMFGAYAGIAASAVLAASLRRWRRLARARRYRSGIGADRPGGFPRRRRALAVPVVLTAMVVALPALMPSRGGAPAATTPAGLRIEVLDVGQGDAILLQPDTAPAVLVDGGPPGDGLVGKLADAGVVRIGAAVASHDEEDHVGGLGELFESIPVGRFLFSRAGRELRREAEAGGARTARIAEGDEVTSGPLDLEVLWPPASLLEEPLDGADPNQQALVLLARWHRFRMLLTADAEAEAVPLDPGPVDVLKVAHHGSDDAGLGALLDRIRPRLAVISVGAGNPYGHPTPGTLRTLASHGVRTLRTDLDGTIAIDVGRRSFRVIAGTD
jgi:competence protein ComEC